MFNPDYEQRLLQHGSPVAQNSEATVSNSADRFIPRRDSINMLRNFTLIDEEIPQKMFNKPGEYAQSTLVYTNLLKNELLGTTINDIRSLSDEPDENADNRKGTRRRLFSFTSPKPKQQDTMPLTLSPLTPSSQKFLSSPRKALRKISSVPYKVLDAPDLQDDFYLNLIDWSAQNMLAVGLGTAVYLWNAVNSQVKRLCDLGCDLNSATSVAWNERGNLLAVGSQQGFVTVWDAAASKKINQFNGHEMRVGALAWNDDLLSSGSRDRLIKQYDTRTGAQSPERCLHGHSQEVCGLKWSPNHQYLASGGNDNRLLVWNQNSRTPIQTFTEHKAAVKAIAWSPHQHGLLTSGGGSADQCIRFWNTLNGQPLQCIDTGSQVCNLLWSKNSSELVSTHGYTQNEILIWKYPSLTHVAKLTGHTYRVLYLALSPDGQSIVTGAGDETLRFWHVFKKACDQKDNKSVLRLFQDYR